MDTKQINSVSDTLSFAYNLSLNESTFRFRGQANFDWTLQPSIYRYNSFKRYQTVDYENNILQAKPKVPQPPLTHTTFDLEWLMLCQHYEIPTRLMDWSTDVLTALFFACYGENKEDGALFICNQTDYQLFSAFDKKVMETQKLVFVNTHVINPRMRTQSGCFMLWGHAPLNREVSTEDYDLWQFHEQNGNKYFIEKLKIPQSSKQKILNELNQVYSISYENLYLKNGFLEKQYGDAFNKLKEQARLMTLYKTDADKLSKSEEQIARSFFRVDCRNMIGSCDNLSQIG
jgi:hypothetical protein